MNQIRKNHVSFEWLAMSASNFSD